ncbi:MAG: prepilin peptidase [Lachnospiraceae bacterium]|nr:prepilin peptidase [Lachnospiraceae bacterium]MDE6982833.1 prepilin peptidase [Lachnospiraceae bacterium]
MLEQCLLLGTLGFHSLEDIRRKEITLMVTLGSAMACLICHIIFQSHSIYNMLGGMVFGGMILLFSILSRGKIGPGDGMVFMLTGLYLGAEKNLTLMFLSFMFAAGWSLIAIGILHKNLKDKIPFIPFLFLAYLVILAI